MSCYASACLQIIDLANAKISRGQGYWIIDQEKKRVNPKFWLLNFLFVICLFCFGRNNFLVALQEKNSLLSFQGELRDARCWRRVIYSFGDTVRYSLSRALWDTDPWLGFRQGCPAVDKKTREGRGSSKVSQGELENAQWSGALCTWLPADPVTSDRLGLVLQALDSSLVKCEL